MYKQIESESEVAQSCPTLSDPMNCSPPGSSVHGIFQARVLEWGAIAFSIWMSFIPHGSFENEKSFENVFSVLSSVIYVTSNGLSYKYNNWKSILSVFKLNIWVKPYIYIR